MNEIAISIVKTIGCLATVTFFSIYSTSDNYNYNYHWLLELLTFISTIATPLFFVVAGYTDASTRSEPGWRNIKTRRLMLVFIFWLTAHYLFTPYQKGYLIHTWFAISFAAIYLLNPMIIWLSANRRYFIALVAVLFVFSFLYDFIFSVGHFGLNLRIEPQYRIWNWLLFYLTGQLLSDPEIYNVVTRKRNINIIIVALPIIYALSWLFERTYLYPLFERDNNSFFLIGSPIYTLVIGVIIASNKLSKYIHNDMIKILLTKTSKSMTGVYILHYSIFALFSSQIVIDSIAIKIAVLLTTFVSSVLLSMLLLSNKATRAIITL